MQQSQKQLQITAFDCYIDCYTSRLASWFSMSWIDDSSLDGVDRSTVELTLFACSVRTCRFPDGLGFRWILRILGTVRRVYPSKSCCTWETNTRERVSRLRGWSGSILWNYILRWSCGISIGRAKYKGIYAKRMRFEFEGFPLIVAFCSSRVEREKKQKSCCRDNIFNLEINVERTVKSNRFECWKSWVDGTLNLSDLSRCLRWYILIDNWWFITYFSLISLSTQHRMRILSFKINDVEFMV